jgi:hypothetical protein
MEAGYEVTDWVGVFGEITEAFKEEEDFKVAISEISLVSGKSMPSLITPYFVLMFDGEKYLLSFTINKYKIEMVAYYSHILTLLLYDNVLVFYDSYVDVKTGQLHFGDNAYEEFKKSIHEKHGVSVCPVCDRPVPKQYINEKTGYCLMCEQETIPNMKFH